MKKGDKALVGNTGFRRYLKTEGHGHFVIDPAKAEADAKFDGVFVLRTNTDLDPLAAMLRYKQLWTVEPAGIIEVVLGGAVVRVPPDVDGRLLAKVLRAVQAVA